MVFVYHGNVEILQAQVAETKDVMNQKYKEIFGDEGYERLERKTKRILNKGSFFNTLEELTAVTGKEFPEDTPSKFLLVSVIDTELDENGRILHPLAKMGCGFYITEKSFEGSGSSKFTDRILASYIHEFNHYILLALQRTPLYVAGSFMTSETGHVRNAKDFFDLVNKLNEENLPPEEKRKQLALGSFAYLLLEVWESSTRILDKMVLESIGIHKDLSWRETDKKYAPVLLHEPRTIVMIPVRGDPFKGLDDKEAIKRIIEWENYFNPLIRIPYSDNLLDSLKSLKVEIMPLQELMKQAYKDNAQSRKKERKRERERVEKVVRDYHRQKAKKKKRKRNK